MSTAAQSPAPAAEVVACEEEHPTNRYLFKTMCKMAGIELGVDKVDVALKKVVHAMRLQAPAVAHSRAALDVLAERRRQIEVEGWDAAHDDEHQGGGMAVAAACYAVAGGLADRPCSEAVSDLWPWTGWAWEWWKPTDKRRNLVKAGALILAEIERLDRADQPPVQGSES